MYEEYDEEQECRLVYFIEEPLSGCIKIGSTGNIQQRLDNLQSSNPNRLVLLGIIGGGVTREFELHRHFACHRLHGEWFAPEIKDAAMLIIEECSIPDEPETPRLLNAHVALLKVGGRARKAFVRLGISNVGELTQTTRKQLLRSSGIGLTSLQEIIQALQLYGLTLKD